MKISESLKDYNNRVDEEFAKFEENTNDLTYAKPLMKYEEGGSLTSIWGMKSLGINPSDGQEIFVNRDGRISYDWVSSEQQILGDTEPEAQGSFGVNLRYKNFTMFASFLYEFGAQAYALLQCRQAGAYGALATCRTSDSIEGYCRQDGDDTSNFPFCAGLQCDRFHVLQFEL